MPAVASAGGPKSQTIAPPSGRRDDRVRALQEDDRAESLRCLSARPRAGARPTQRRVRAEQSGELACVRREHGRRRALDGLELEERVGVDDGRQIDALEELANECAARVTAPEPRAERDRAAHAPRLRAIVSTASSSRPADLDRLERQAPRPRAATRSGTASVT